jgi:nucleolar protein 58
MNLAKQPASTVQILGAEKALFRALKTKHDTPKYGLIYHASLIGQATPKNKGKISRVLAAKASLAIRVDALSDETSEHIDTTIGYEGRAKVEARLRQLEGGSASFGNGNLTASKTAKYNPVVAKAAAAAPEYNDSSEMVLETTADETKKSKKEKKKKEKESSKKKRKAEEVENGDEEDEAAEKAAKKAAKKAKKEKRKSKEKE